MTDEANRSVDLTLLKIAFLEKCYDYQVGPVLLGFCPVQPTSLSSMVVLQPPLLSKDGVVILCVCLGKNPVLMAVH